MALHGLMVFAPISASASPVVDYTCCLCTSMQSKTNFKNWKPGKTERSVSLYKRTIQIIFLWQNVPLALFYVIDKL